jgi:hypothetical protein
MTWRTFMFISLLSGFLCGIGCSAYRGLIGHPVHVLMEEHRYNKEHPETNSPTH